MYVSILTQLHRSSGVTDFWGETISGVGKLDLDVQDCRFERCRFEHMKFKRWSSCLAAGTERSHYIDCIFDGSRFTHLGVGQARFERCQFRDVHITDLFSHAAEFVDCTFSGKLKGAVFFGKVVGFIAEHTTRTHNEIRGNDFSALKMIDCDFRQGVDLRVGRGCRQATIQSYTCAMPSESSRQCAKDICNSRHQSSELMSSSSSTGRRTRCAKAKQSCSCARRARFEPADERKIWRELDAL